MHDVERSRYHRRTVATNAPRWARYDIWNVGIATLAHPLTDVRELKALGSIRWLPPQPPLAYLADPFPYRDASGREWLLVEEYRHRRGGRGCIARVNLSDLSSPLERVIAGDGHVSYPYTFTDAGRICCAPQMAAEDGVAIHVLGHDGSWNVAHRVLRGHRLVDPTVFHHDGRWWLFGTDVAPRHNSVLRAFHAETIAGPWMPHERNPIKEDAASSRPAGRPFAIGGRLFRPAQDCSETYGGAVHVMEVHALSSSTFDESVALRLEADLSWPYPDGLHHLVVDGARVFFDAKRTHVDYLLWAKQ
jgi:hypothetical protein